MVSDILFAYKVSILLTVNTVRLQVMLENFLDINLDNTTFAISSDLISIIQELTNTHPPYHGGQYAVTINFKDEDYSPESGGYHPVEIRLINRRGKWLFDYVTDFGYVGPVYPELEKIIDFGIDDQYTWVAVYGDIPMKEGRELFELWQENFNTYYHMGIYSVSVEWE